MRTAFSHLRGEEIALEHTLRSINYFDSTDSIKRGAMKKLLSLLFFLLLFSCLPKQGGASTQTVQDRAAEIPQEFQDYPIVILKDSSTVRMSDERDLLIGNTTVYYVQKENPALLREIAIPFSMVSEEPVHVACQVRYPDGSQWELSGYDIKKSDNRRSYDMSVIGNSSEIRSFTIPRYSQGMEISLTVIRKHKGNLFTPALFFREQHPILLKKISIDTTASHHILRNGEGLTIADTTIGKMHHYHARNCKPQRSRYYSKHDEKWYAAVHLSRFALGNEATKGWSDLGDQYLLYIAEEERTDSTIKELANQFKGETLQESCELYYREIVNRVRYLFYLDSVSAITPELPGKVISAGYGDCKGMSNLFCHLLQESHPEVPSGLALVATEGLELHNDAPSLDRFNHMVCWVVVEGDTLYIDPTNNAASWNTSFWPLVHRKTLILEEGKSRIGRVVSNRNFRNKITTQNCISLDATSEKKLTITGTVTLEGYASSLLYRYVNHMNSVDKKGYMKKWLLKRFNIETDTVITSQIGYDRSSLTYTTSVKKPYIDVDNGGIKLTVPSTYGGKTGYTTIEHEGYYSFKILEQEDCWELPEGFSELEAISFDAELYSGTLTHQGACVTRRYNIKNTPLVTSKELGGYFADKRKINNAIIWR